MDKFHRAPTAAKIGHDVICIEAKQICDYCFQEQRIERVFQAELPPPPSPTDPTTPPSHKHHKKPHHLPLIESHCEIIEEDIRCRVVSRKSVDGKKADKELICVAIEVPVVIRVFDASGQPVDTIVDRVVFLKQAILCAPTGTRVDCQVTGECCCFFDPNTGLVTCTFDFCVILQTHVVTRVLVPSLGICPPKRCEATVLGCPPTLPPECKSCEC